MTKPRRPFVLVCLLVCLLPAIAWTGARLACYGGFRNGYLVPIERALLAGDVREMKNQLQTAIAYAEDKYKLNYAALIEGIPWKGEKILYQRDQSGFIKYNCTDYGSLQGPMPYASMIVCNERINIERLNWALGLAVEAQKQSMADDIHVYNRDEEAIRQRRDRFYVLRTEAERLMRVRFQNANDLPADYYCYPYKHYNLFFMGGIASIIWFILFGINYFAGDLAKLYVQRKRS